MHRKFRIIVDGRPYNVVVEDMTETGGTAASPLGSASVVAPAHPPATAAAAAPAAAVAVAERPSAAAAPAAASAGDEVAPLAGVVQSIEVTVGQQVNENDRIAVLEAMKMKTVVHAKRSGKVIRVLVKPGDGVESGQPLLTIG